MRSLLMTLLLLMAIIWIYSRTIGGESGAEQQLWESGGRAGTDVSQIDP